jgi:hypothetical protein
VVHGGGGHTAQFGNVLHELGATGRGVGNAGSIAGYEGGSADPADEFGDYAAQADRHEDNGSDDPGAGECRADQAERAPVGSAETLRWSPKGAKENRFEGVEAILGLVEHPGTGMIHDLVRHLFPAVGRQAMEEDGVALGQFE